MNLSSLNSISFAVSIKTHISQCDDYTFIIFCHIDDLDFARQLKLLFISSINFLLLL